MLFLNNSVRTFLLLLAGSRLAFSFPIVRGNLPRRTTSAFAVSSASLSYVAATPETNEDAKRLAELGIHMPFGLRRTIVDNLETIPKRFWILDNSGSMALLDGHCILTGGANDDGCSRWSEVLETVKVQSHLSATLAAPTDFRLLNAPKGGLLKGSKKFRVGQGHAGRDTRRANSILKRAEPKGMTPLPACIREVEQEIRQMKPELEAKGQRACLVLATDGCNYNIQNIGAGHTNDPEEARQEELLKALESLEGLPVCVVIRLCTDYQPLVDFYNSLDTRLDIDIDVLDDHRAEAIEVTQQNPWLNYGLVLHRVREMGQDNRLFDLIDERPLTKEEIRDFCVLLFGHEERLSADDWPAFVEEIDRIQLVERPQWNPITKAMAPWIDVEELALIED